jgi:aspartokinase
MNTVTAILRKTLQKYPFYAEALGRGIVNYSALARILKDEIQNQRMETVSDEAIAIALKRASQEQKKKLSSDQSIQPVLGLTIRSGLSVFSFEKSPQLTRSYQKLLKYTEKLDNPFLHYDQGMRDVNFIVSTEIVPTLKRLTINEKLFKTYHECSIITVTMSHKSLDYPGVCERFFRALAWEQINLISFFHTHGEVSFVVEKKDSNKAYELINSLAE